MISQNNTKDPHPLPPVAPSSFLLTAAYDQIVVSLMSMFKTFHAQFRRAYNHPLFIFIMQEISNSSIFNSTCAKCQASMAVAKMVALAAPSEGPALAVALCNHFQFNTDCEGEYGINDFGSVLTQVTANADAAGLDGEYFCHSFLSLCPAPSVSPLNMTGWFKKPKPNPLPIPKKPSGQRLKVLHLSDIHIDPR